MKPKLAAVMIAASAALVLLAPTAALAAEYHISGSGQGAESVPFLANNGTLKMSGSWSSGRLFGPSGTYTGTIALGQHLDCFDAYAPPGTCAPTEMNCTQVSGGTVTFSGYLSGLSPTTFSVTMPISNDALHNSLSAICQPPLPGNPRYIYLKFNWYQGPTAPVPSTGLGTPSYASGALEGTSLRPAWTVPGGPAWDDTFTFALTISNSQVT
jgi:hypothetical protein